MSALSFIWIMIYAPQQCSHFPPTMRLIWGAPGPWSTVSLQYGVLQIFIILKPPNMSNYSAFKPTGGTSTGTRHHHHPSPSRATLARKYQGSHSALIRVDLNLGVWTYSWWWLRVADIVRYGLLHWLIILGAQSAAHNIWLYTLDAEVTKLFEAACCQSVCLRPIWQLHPRVSCPHQLNIGVNTGHGTRDTARTRANDWGLVTGSTWPRGSTRKKPIFQSWAENNFPNFLLCGEVVWGIVR